MFYVFYELSMISVLFSLLGCGRQVEKISACYYLLAQLKLGLLFAAKLAKQYDISVERVRRSILI